MITGIYIKELISERILLHGSLFTLDMIRPKKELKLGLNLPLEQRKLFSVMFIRLLLNISEHMLEEIDFILDLTEN